MIAPVESPSSCVLLRLLFVMRSKGPAYYERIATREAISERMVTDFTSRSIDSEHERAILQEAET